MSKKMLQDVIKINNIKKIEENKGEMFYSGIKKNIPSSNKMLNIKEKKKVSHNMLWFIALISTIFLFFAITFLFSSATVTINPKIKDFVLNKTFSATKNTSTSDGLTYDLVVLSGEEKKEVKGGEEKDWEVHATGSALIYNAFSLSAQPLLIDTRLEGSNGKIYKTKTKVIVPGMSKDGTPGKIGVDIYGVDVGEEYNSAPLDFKVLVFKGTSKYSKIYARSVGDITGGLKGTSSQLSVIEKENATKELKEILALKLFEKTKNQIPKDFILLKDSTFFNVDEENITSLATTGLFSVSVKGTFNGIIFNKENLEKEIINVTLDKSDNVDAYISNIKDLSFSEPNKEFLTPNDMKDITFNLSGTAKVVWKIDGDKLLADLLGKDKKDFSKILLKYPNVDSANLAIKPVWENSFPNKYKNIKIIVNYPK